MEFTRKINCEEKFNLVKNTKSNTQLCIIAEIFEENIGKKIAKREIETKYCLIWTLREIDNNIKLNKNELLNKLLNKKIYVPGDIQRQVKTFYKKFHKYGLKKIEKKISNDNEIYYIWEPINMNELEDIIRPAARNLFTSESERNEFIKKKKYKCEMCNANKKDNETLRMAIDHWRAHSVYNIDDKRIAVLMCEKCNNIHHNYDACKIALKYKENTTIIKKWIKKEREIRSYDFEPNEKDLEQQLSIKIKIDEYHKKIDPLSNNFWEGLF